MSIRIDLLADTVDMRGRTIAPDHASKQEAVGAIWTVLSHPLAAIENIKCNWKNLALEVKQFVFHFRYSLAADL